MAERPSLTDANRHCISASNDNQPAGARFQAR
jgi:hypothetical protein